MRRATIVGVLAAILVLVPGCWDRVEIEDRAAVLAVGFDPGPGPGQLLLTAQIAIPGRIPLGPSPGGGGGATQNTRQTVFLGTAQGRSVAEALDDLQNTLSAQIFLGHLRVIVVSQTLARAGMAPLMEYFRRDPQVRRTSWLIISQNPAAEVVSLAPSFSRVPALFLSDMLDHNVNTGRLPVTFLGHYWDIASSEGQEPILPYLRARGQFARLLGVAVLREQRMVDVISMTDLPAYMEASGSRQAAEIVTVPMPGDPRSPLRLRVIRRQSVVTPELVGGRPRVSIHISLEANVLEKNSTHKLNRVDQLATADREAERVVRESILRLIARTQRERADVFGFGEQFRGKQPAFWRRVREHASWFEAYPNVSADVVVEFRIRRVGMENR